MDHKPDKSLGQHWLTDRDILEQIADYAQINDHDLVIEVGPGLGTLTGELLKKARKVVAVEFDSKLHENLHKTRQKLFGQDADKLELVNQDILKFNFSQVKQDYKVVANIPYYLTSKLIRILGDLENRPKVIVLLIQKEVAERICASPGQMSLLSVYSQMNFDCQLGIVVKADKFSPPPKVDSRVVIMNRLEHSLDENSNQKNLNRILKCSFMNKRKTLVNSLSSGMSMSKAEITEILNTLSINPNARPQELSIHQWLELETKFD